MPKNLSILSVLTLNAAGFSKGIDEAKGKTQSLVKGTQQAGNVIKSSFGNLAGVFSPMLGDLGNLKTSIFSGVSAFKTMIPAINGVKAAFITTGIGAIVIALTTAFAALISWMKRSDEGSDTLRKVFDSIKAVINTVLDKLMHLGGALVQLFKGNFKQAWEEAKQAFTGWGSAIADNIKKAGELNEIQDELENKQEVYAKKRAELEVRISELQNISRDEENYNAKQRMYALNQLKAKYKELYDLDFALKNQELQVVLKENSLHEGNQDLRQKANEKEAELIRLRAEYNGNLRETIKLSKKISADLADEVLTEQINKEKQQNAGYKPIKPIGITQVSGGTDSKSNLEQQQEGLKNYVSNLVAYQEKTKEINEANKTLASSFQELQPIMKGFFSNIADGLSQGAESFAEYGKSVANTIRSTISAYIGDAVAAMVAGQFKFFAKFGPIGIGLGVAAASLAKGLVTTAFNTLIPKFANGGIVGGYSFYGDKIPALVNSGEMILNARQQANLFGMINRDSQSSLNGEVVFRMGYNELVGILKQGDKKYRNFR